MGALKDAVVNLVTNPAVLIIGTVTLVQIVPIKINPWTALFKWISKMVNGDLQKELTELKADFEDTKADTMRWDILTFANGCRNKQKHTKEEWEHVITQIKKYETYVEEKGIDNGVIEEESKYLRELYHDILRDNDFLF